VVNKADRDGVAETVRDLEMMLDLSGMMEWRPPVVQTIATRGEGVDELWAAIGEHRAFQQSSGQLQRRREERLRDELRAIVFMRLRAQVDATLSGDRFEKLVGQVAAHELDPYAAAQELLGH
jgi:LAO/AO transport system kinase